MGTTTEQAQSNTPFSAKTERLITLVQVLFPILAALATAAWAINGYFVEQRGNRSQQEAAQKTRVTEAQKPFLELQLRTYTAAASVAGQLASEDPTSHQWQDAKTRFYALYWSELSLVEDDVVKARMVSLERALQNFTDDGAKRAALQEQVYCLAVALKASIAAGWQIEVNPAPLAKQDPYNQRYCRET